MDPRIKKLADLLIGYSCDIQPGEKILISYEGECCKSLVRQLIKNTYERGGMPYTEIRDSAITREILLGSSEEQIEFLKDCQLAQMKGMDAYIAIRAGENTSELSDVPAEKLNMYSSITQPVLDQRVNKTKWVILRYPNGSMAQLAGKSQEAFEDFFFDVCTLDYRKMSKAMDPLVELMERTDKVRIKGPGTDLRFSINGTISYNTPSEEQGFTYENIVFKIKDGKIVKAMSNNNERINQLLDTDDGARYFGEFALGVNPYILHPMKDTLFDEKIAGRFHLTPGAAYEDAFNGNKSSVHWDLVMIQRPEYGGGEIYFDDVLIRKDGIFVIPELEGLNPENLK